MGMGGTVCHLYSRGVVGLGILISFLYFAACTIQRLHRSKRLCFERAVPVLEVVFRATLYGIADTCVSR